MQAKKIDELLKKGAYDVFQDDYLEAVTRRAGVEELAMILPP